MRLRDPQFRDRCLIYAGLALAQLKRTREAMSQYAGALLLQPDYPDALDGLAWILSTDPNTEFRNGAARRSRNQSSAELYSAVSRICNPLAAAEADDFATPGAPPNAIRRYCKIANLRYACAATKIFAIMREVAR